jgi:hypothetical protein
MTNIQEGISTKKSDTAKGLIRINTHLNELDFFNETTKKKFKATISPAYTAELNAMYKFAEKNNRGYAKASIQITIA